MRTPRNATPAGRAPAPTSRAILALSIIAIVLALGCGGSSGGGGGGPTAPIVPGVTTASTDAQGVAAMTDEAGDTLLIAQAYDDQGNPLDDIDVIYWEASPDPLIGFTVEGSGEPAGFFFVELEAAPAMASPSAESAASVTSAGVFILNRLDPTLSRLYDAKQDGFTPDYGIETPIDGMVSEDVVSVFFEPGGAPPVLSNLTYDPTAPCPDGDFAMAYHFEDPDGDALSAHLRVAWRFNDGSRDSVSIDIPVHAAGGECMQGFVGDCEFVVFSFEGFDGGETVTARLWVEDAAGNDSNILIADYTVTGSCTQLRPSAAARRFEVYPRY